MLSFMPQHKLEQIKEVSGGGAAAVPPVVPAAASAPAGEVETDDLGYEIMPAKKQVVDVQGAKAATDEAEKARAEGRAANDAAKPDDQKIDPSTGYGEEPPKVEEPVKKEEPAAKPDLAYELKLEGLPKEEVEKVAAFAKKHALSQEVAQEFADLRKSELKAAEERAASDQREQEQAKMRLRREWHTELKNDPQFGGEKFGFNIMQAEKVVQEFMPNTKKVLTDRKSMLPPYVMRDLARMASTLYSTEKLGQGEAPAAPKKNDVDEALEFYNN